MRLIDADLLKDKIVWLPHVNGIPATVNYNRPLIDIAQAIEAINEQLTAYDVDKVLAKMEEYATNVDSDCDDVLYSAIDDLMLIVKGGIQ